MVRRRIFRGFSRCVRDKGTLGRSAELGMLCPLPSVLVLPHVA